MKRFALVLGFLLCACSGSAEDLPLGAKPELALIESTQALTAWTSALQSLSQGARTRVVVCHFGDSHLQAGPLDGVLRQALQERWGDAGRGYVFPFEATYTSNPADLASSSDVEWSLSRMMGSSAISPVGAGGLSAISRSIPFALSLAQRPAITASAGFDRVRVYYEPCPTCAELWIATRADANSAEAMMRDHAWRQRIVASGETLTGIAVAESVTVSDLRRWNGIKLKIRAGQTLRLHRDASENRSRLAGYTVWGVLKGDDLAGRSGVVVDLGSLVNQVFILGVQASSNQTHAELQGVSLERSTGKGLVWNTLAANGAQAKHFTRAANLSQQLAAMAPDLIIVSLGTNETQQSDYKKATALAEQVRFWRLLKRLAPHASLLICSPPDAKPLRHNADRLDNFVAGLREEAASEGLAFFDLREVQGGQGSYARWREDGFAGRDGVHYTGSGYRWMGQWFLNALQGLEAPHVP